MILVFKVCDCWNAPCSVCNRRTTNALEDDDDDNDATLTAEWGAGLVQQSWECPVTDATDEQKRDKQHGTKPYRHLYNSKQVNMKKNNI